MCRVRVESRRVEGGGESWRGRGERGKNQSKLVELLISRRHEVVESNLASSLPSLISPPNHYSLLTATMDDDMMEQDYEPQANNQEGGYESMDQGGGRNTKLSVEVSPLSPFSRSPFHSRNVSSFKAAPLLEGSRRACTL